MRASESFAKRLSLKVLAPTISLVVLTFVLIGVATYRSLTDASEKIALNRLDLSIMSLDTNPAGIEEILKNFKPSEHSYAVLVDGKGDYVFLPDSGYILKKNIIEDADATGNADFKEISRRLVAGEHGTGHVRHASGTSMTISYGPLKNGWREAIITPYRDIFGRANNLILLLELITAVCLILLYLINKRTISHESQPITEFTYAALNLAQGKFDARIPEVSTEDEIKRLHDSLHYLERSIGRYIKELKTTTSAKERIESELTVASNIQMSMLTRNFPQRDGLDVRASLHPAKEVGGDLYDCFIDDGWLYFAVGDVSGKGVPAALFMAITLAAFRFISRMGLGMNEVAGRINNSFAAGNKEGMFVTLFIGKIKLDTLEMEYCNAGHNPVMTISPDGKPSLLKSKPNIAAGLFEDFPYEKETMRLQRGSRLLIYTDGVSEAENPSKELYGEQRMLDLAGSRPAAESSEDFISALSADVAEFTSGAGQNDDITILSIKL